MTDNQRNPQTRLESAVDALRDLPTAAGPDEAFHKRLLDRLASHNQTPLKSQRQPEYRRITMRRVTVFAASLLLVAALAAVMTSLNFHEGSAFARMREQVNSARTVVFTTHIAMRNVHQGMETKTMLLEPDWVREEMFEGKERHVTVLIFNLKERKSLSLTPSTKKARLRTLDPESPPPKNIVEEIREMRESSAELLGTEKIDGKEANKYRCNRPTGHYLIWLAKDSELPVKVEMSESAGSPELTITMTDFQWNVPLDESLFTLDVPKGYELEAAEPAAPLKDPKNFIEAMRMYVRLNNDQFPDEYNALTASSIIKFLDDPSLPPEKRKAFRRHKVAQALDRPKLEKSDEEWKKFGPENAKRFASAAIFLQLLSETHEWHYVGKGVKFGQADKVVAWWAPKGNGGKAEKAETPGSATVLYGDFHMDRKPVAGLPRETK